MEIFNNFLNSKTFDNLNKFIAKKIFKIFKRFFVETDLKSLPTVNYPLNNDHINLNSDILFEDNKKPYLSYFDLPNLLSAIYRSKNKINILDYGAANLNLYYFLNQNFENIRYYFEDQLIIKKKVDEIIKEKKLQNIFLNGTSPIYEDFDIIYFGSSLQYINDYKSCLRNCCKKTKYILIAQLPVFFNSALPETVVLKQLNMHPDINYLYLFNFDPLISIMEKHNFSLKEKNINKVTKFLNFKNFNKDKFRDINMYDLLFELKNEKK